MRLRAAGFAQLAFLASVSAAAAADVGGTYTVQGTNLDGSKYGGTADITMTSNTACQIAWHNGDAPPLTGICMRDGDTFAVSFLSNGAAGLVLYKIEPDGTLNGVWTMPNQSGIGTDVLTPDITSDPGSPITSDPGSPPGGDSGH